MSAEQLQSEGGPIAFGGRRRFTNGFKRQARRYAWYSVDEEFWTTHFGGWRKAVLSVVASLSITGAECALRTTLHAQARPRVVIPAQVARRLLPEFATELTSQADSAASGDTGSQADVPRPERTGSGGHDSTLFAAAAVDDDSIRRAPWYTPPVFVSAKAARNYGASLYAPPPFAHGNGASTDKAPWYAPLASLAVPGGGQALMRQSRSLGYVVAETFLIIGAVRTNHEKTNSKTEYKRLASEVARAGFGTVRPDGPWEYYETLEEYTASGAYELNPGGVFTPETDVSTYNGQKWLQARQTFWADPNSPPPATSDEFQRAVAFYQSRAISGSYRWTWRDHGLEQAAYAQTIKDHNRSRQHFVTAVGLVAANHLTSMVDAYINVRVRRFGGAGLAGVSIRSGLEQVEGPLPASIAYRASLDVSIAFPKGAQWWAHR